MLLASRAADKPLNLVLITADDMNWDPAGCNGCTIPGITPDINRLAAESIRFREAPHGMSGVKVEIRRLAGAVRGKAGADGGGA